MGNDEQELSEEFDTVGLCRTCQHAKVVETARGSTFYLCRLSETDPRFPKYPRLPVVRCMGYERKADR
jgi:hypothetical protein